MNKAIEGEEREGRKMSGQQSSVPQTGNVSPQIPQLLCLASMLLQLNQSSMNSSYNNFQVSASQNSPFTLTAFSHCSSWLSVWSESTLFASMHLCFLW